MKYLVILLTLISLTSCSNKPVKCDPVIIKVPVRVPSPVPPEVVRPTLPLGNADNNSDKAKELATTVEALKSYTLELEGYLDSYRKTTKEYNQKLEEEK